MKSCIKVFAFLFLGLLIVILIYPFLHELGHVLASFVVGVECMELHLLPMPYVLCDMSNAKEIDYYVIGSAGILFPFIIAKFFQPFCRKNIYINFFAFVIDGITALACVISLISIFLLQFGYKFKEDDIVNVLIRTNSNPTIIKSIITALLAIITIIIIIIIKGKIFQKIINYI